MDSHFNYLFNNKYNLHYQFDNRGSAWFYADEIARYLGYSRARDMVRMAPGSYVVLNINNPIISEYGLDMNQTLSETLSALSALSSNQEHRSQFTIIHESGVYLIAMNAKANRPEVEEFKNWVIYELLPSIRRFGAYVSPDIRDQLQANPNYINDIINQNAKLEQDNAYLKHVNRVNYDERTRVLAENVSLHKRNHDLSNNNIKLNNQVNELRDYKVNNEQYNNIGKAFYQNETNISINELAKVVSSKLNKSIGEHEVRILLRSNGYLMKIDGRNVPTQYSITNELLKLSFSEIDRKPIVVVTPKGIDYFITWISNIIA